MRQARPWHRYLALQGAAYLGIWFTLEYFAPGALFLCAMAFVAGLALAVKNVIESLRNFERPAEIVTTTLLAAAALHFAWAIALFAYVNIMSIPPTGSGYLLLLVFPLAVFSTGCMIHMRLGPFRTFLPPMERVRQILTEKPGANFGGAASESRIAEAERILGLTLPKSYREFLATWGELEFLLRRFLGIPASMDMAHPTPADAVGATLQAREHAGLPSQLVVCATRPDGLHACLNTFAMREQEAPVVVWDGPSRTVLRTLAPTFAVFLRNRLEAVSRFGHASFVNDSSQEEW